MVGATGVAVEFVMVVAVVGVSFWFNPLAIAAAKDDMAEFCFKTSVGRRTGGVLSSTLVSVLFGSERAVTVDGAGTGRLGGIPGTAFGGDSRPPAIEWLNRYQTCLL